MELKVAVRTPEPEVSARLKDDLGDLVQKLENRGYRAETWTPGDGQNSSLQQSKESSSSSHAGGQQQQSGDNGQSYQQGRRQHQRQPQDWVWELERTAEDEETGKEPEQWRQILKQ